MGYLVEVGRDAGGDKRGEATLDVEMGEAVDPGGEDALRQEVNIVVDKDNIEVKYNTTDTETTEQLANNIRFETQTETTEQAEHSVEWLVQEQKEEKKDVIQLPTTPKKVESRPIERQEVDESSTSSESSEEEEEPEPELVRRSTRQRKPPERQDDDKSTTS
ncbi:probable chromatin modification-related protein eaf7 [Cryptomeria japonica]|uniref:probable chromatin modification-related protein eaf7 n=1 Tax=Cryptomeria japonica TaxID=3369 RepID=UPI0027DA2E6A|nr:probable chromatin modification-related protein eaf7 [Cryptomeria japonica]